MKQSVYDHLSLTSFSPFLVSFYHLSPVILKCVYRVHCGHCYCVISIIIYIVNTIHHYIIIIYSCLKFLCLSPTMKHSIISSIYIYIFPLFNVHYLLMPLLSSSSSSSSFSSTKRTIRILLLLFLSSFPFV